MKFLLILMIVITPFFSFANDARDTCVGGAIDAESYRPIYDMEKLTKYCSGITMPTAVCLASVFRSTREIEDSVKLKKFCSDITLEVAYCLSNYIESFADYDFIYIKKGCINATK